MGFSVIGTGSALPKKRVTNTELTSFLDTSDEWIKTRTGICERRIITGETMTELAVSAAKKALENASSAASEIDLLICPTLRGDYVSPSLSCIVAGQLGLRDDCVVFDVNMGCCGFVYALNIADSYFKAGSVRKALIVASDALSRLADWEDRSTSVLFGDTAAAAVLEVNGRETFFDVNLKPNVEFLYVDRPADNCPYNDFQTKPTLKMNGQEVYRFASSAIHARIEAVIKKAGLTVTDVDKFILHQANIRIIQSCLYISCRLPEEKCPS